MLIAPLPETRIADAVELWHETGLTRPWNDPVDDARRALAGPTSTVLAGIADDGRLLATAMVGHDGRRGWVYYVAVREDARGHGHGAAVMRAGEAWLAERDIVKLNLMIRTDNLGARGFYQAIGYSVDDVVFVSRRLD